MAFNDYYLWEETKLITAEQYGNDSLHITGFVSKNRCDEIQQQLPYHKEADFDLIDITNTSLVISLFRHNKTIGAGSNVRLWEADVTISSEELSKTAPAVQSLMDDIETSLNLFRTAEIVSHLNPYNKPN